MKSNSIPASLHTIVVTGASRGIGLELVRQYGLAGSRVFATCRELNGNQELMQCSGDIYIEQLDVTDPISIERFAGHIAGSRIDILFNNAGIDLTSCTFDAWTRVFETNISGAYFVTKALLPYMRTAQQSLVVAITSRLGSLSLNKEGGFYAYRMSKTALNMMIKNLSIEFKSENICFLAISPGRVQTRLGGADAPLTAKESVAQIRDTLKSIGLDRSGSFLDLYGNAIPW